MRHWRWLVWCGAVGVLCALPVLAAVRPVPTTDITTEELVQRVAASADEAFHGLYESRGGLRLPDLGRFDDQIAAFTQTSRVRVWYAGPERWRTDELLIGAERSVYREPGGIWLWDSGKRRVVSSPRSAVEPLRIPRLMDLSPPEIGRRLLGESAGETIERIDDRWVAGTASVGLRVTPSDTTSTIESVDLWVEPDTGLVTAVEVDTGGTAPAFETEFADLRLTAPEPDVMQFDPVAAGEPVRTSATLDVVEFVGQERLLPLPLELAGLARRNDPDAGLATYGDGLSIVNLFALPQGNLGRTINRIPRTERPWGGSAIVINTSLVNVQILELGQFDVVLSGTVDMAELDRIAGVLAERGTFL